MARKSPWEAQGCILNRRMTSKGLRSGKTLPSASKREIVLFASWCATKMASVEVAVRAQGLVLQSHLPQATVSPRRFEHQVKRCLGSATEMRESAGLHHFPDLLLSSLCAQGHADLLRQRSRSADHGGRSIEDPPDGMQVALDIVFRARLDNHPRPARHQRTKDVFRRSHRIAHIVQTVEERDQVIVVARVSLGRGYFEDDAISHARLRCQRARPLDRSRVVIETDEL